jgi:EAL domain-containing protein (putative c-di-GMP-specific phosphodiesterase class I)
MAVNLSPLQFASPALLDSVREVLQRHRIDRRG